MENNNLLEKVASLAKRRGFIFPGSEIYGGMANTWDYGPLGTELKNNIKQAWWNRYIHKREDIVGIDAAIIMNPKVWEASGHLQNFTDPLIECKSCHERFRADQVVEVGFTKGVSCPKCHTMGSLADIKSFNLMFKTFFGSTEETANVAYLRPETAQAMFVNFKNVVDTTRNKLPFGIAQMGKAFRNEITPGNFVFRTREFEQMEIEYFINPPKDDSEWEKYFNIWQEEMIDWMKNVLGINMDKIHILDVPAEDRAHYSKKTIDFEYDFPFGKKELYGLAYRTDFDLKNHEQFSGQNLKYKDPQTGEEYWPHIIEPTWGVDRSILVVLLDSYQEENGRVVLKLKPRLAPFKAAVFPLLGNKPELSELAKKVYLELRQSYMIAWDDRGNIGGRYASQDEIGTPYCITVDFQSLEDSTVTVRDRDTTKQDRIKIDKLAEYLEAKLK